MPSVSRGAFAAPAVPQVERVPLPEAGEGAYVCVRALPARDLVELRAIKGRTADTDSLEFVHELLWRVLCDDAGTTLFDSAADLAGGFNLPVRTLTRLADEAVKIAGLSATEKN